MKNLVDARSFPSVRCPEDGDAVNGASIEAGLQDLANRTLLLRPRSPLILPLASGIASPSSATYAYFGSGLRAVTFNASGQVYILPISLPDGVTLSSVLANVQHGNAGAGGQMSMSIWRNAIDATDGVQLQLGSTLSFTAGTGYHAQSVAIAANNVIDNSLYEYFAEVKASTLAGTNSDTLWHATATFA